MHELGQHTVLEKARHLMRSTCGFSIVEILIATLILGAVSSAAFNFYQNQHEQYMRQSDVTDVQQSVRITMQELTNQIRRAGYLVFGQPAVEISATGDTLLVRYSEGGVIRSQLFYVSAHDRNKDYHMEYELTTQLDGGLPQVFAENIDSIAFVGGGTGGGIQWIDITIRGELERTGLHRSQQDGMQTQEIERTLTSTVKLRNR